jgi:methionyl-tRNA synthetase
MSENESQQPKPLERVPSAEREEITIEDFGKLDLRVARILEASEIEGADRLLKLRIDLGGETRQLVAGIKKSYPPEALVGKHIVVVANLKPTKLRGVESQGMLLAASTDDGPVLATFEKEVAPGSRVK